MKTLTFMIFLSFLSSFLQCEKEPQCIDLKKREELKNTGCILLYSPVCGCDGKTYGNYCEADRAGVLSYVDGPCKGDTSGK